MRDVVKLNYKTAPLFQANNIDYCCGGHQPISEACMEAGINADQLIRELEVVVSQQDPDSDTINSLETGELCDYIEKRHHAYVRERIPYLSQNLEKICGVHGHRHPELLIIRDLFFTSGNNLILHMLREETMLFPYIWEMESFLKENSPVPQARFGTVMNPIQRMMKEHQDEGDRFAEIARLSNQYQVPDDGCVTYEVTLKQLKEFEDDLHRHVHLENNILFPRAIELEKK